MKKVSEITVHELKTLIDANDAFTLLDVREPEEFELCNIEGSLLVPLDELEEHISEFDPEQPYVVHCKMGGRSEKAAKILMEKGFNKVKNLKGGIQQWAQEIDQNINMY